MKKLMKVLAVVLLGLILIACGGKKNPNVSKTSTNYSTLASERFYGSVVDESNGSFEQLEFSNKEKGILAKALRIQYKGYDIGRMVVGISALYSEAYHVNIIYNTKYRGSITFTWDAAEISIPFGMSGGDINMLDMTSDDVDTYTKVKKDMESKYGEREAKEIMNNLYEEYFEPKFVLEGDRVDADTVIECAQTMFQEMDLDINDIDSFVEKYPASKFEEQGTEEMPAPEYDPEDPLNALSPDGNGGWYYIRNILDDVNGQKPDIMIPYIDKFIYDAVPVNEGSGSDTIGERISKLHKKYPDATSNVFIYVDGSDIIYQVYFYRNGIAFGKLWIDIGYSFSLLGTKLFVREAEYMKI